MKKQFKALKSFSAASMGSLEAGQIKTLDVAVGAQLVEAGLLEAVENIPLSSAGADGKQSQSSPAVAVSQKSKPKKSAPRKKPAKQK